jgi:hypothetical protein
MSFFKEGWPEDSLPVIYGTLFPAGVVGLLDTCSPQDPSLALRMTWEYVVPTALHTGGVPWLLPISCPYGTNP